MDHFRYVGGRPIAAPARLTAVDARRAGNPLAERPARSHLRGMDVVGPTRETTDAFAKDRRAGP